MESDDKKFEIVWKLLNDRVCEFGSNQIDQIKRQIHEIYQHSTNLGNLCNTLSQYTTFSDYRQLLVMVTWEIYTITTDPCHEERFQLIWKMFCKTFMIPSDEMGYVIHLVNFCFRHSPNLEQLMVNLIATTGLTITPEQQRVCDKMWTIHNIPNTQQMKQNIIDSRNQSHTLMKHLDQLRRQTEELHTHIKKLKTCTQKLTEQRIDLLSTTIRYSPFGTRIDPSILDDMMSEIGRHGNDTEIQKDFRQVFFNISRTGMRYPEYPFIIHIFPKHSGFKDISIQCKCRHSNQVVVHQRSCYIDPYSQYNQSDDVIYSSICVQREFCRSNFLPIKYRKYLKGLILPEGDICIETYVDGEFLEFLYTQVLALGIVQRPETLRPIAQCLGMAGHPRLGSDSPIQILSGCPNILKFIADHACDPYALTPLW